MPSAEHERHVRFVLQETDIAGLLDHLVGAGEDCWRQLDAQRLGDAEVDPEIELGGTFERQVAWLCAFQNAIKLRDQVTGSVGKIRPVRHEAAIGEGKIAGLLLRPTILMTSAM